jgi:hypothetical protein
MVIGKLVFLVIWKLCNLGLSLEDAFVVVQNLVVAASVAVSSVALVVFA